MSPEPGGRSQQQTVDPRVDSGYSSLTATPATDGTSEKAPGRFKLFSNEGDEAAGCARRLFSPRSDLVCFDNWKPLDETTVKWFEDVGPRIEQLLVEFLKSGRRFLSPKFTPIAIRLMVLGQNESSARPHLVVFAPSKGSRKIEKFFAREEVKELLVPSSGSDLIAVVVTAHTSFLMCRVSDISALYSNDSNRRSRHTLCGLPITVNGRNLTFGGIIRVLGSDNTSGWKLYGLTAGHFTDEKYESEGEPDDLDDESSESESDEDDEDDDDDDPMRDAPVPVVRPAIPPPVTPSTRSWDWPEAMTLGNVLEFDDAQDVSKPDLDWSLLQMNCLLPNFLDSMERSHGIDQMADLVAPGPTGLSCRKVVVASGTRGLQRGRLHSSPTRVLLGRSETFSSAYILKLEDGTIGEGDSGSWVVDPLTFEALGHVVAKDVLGDAYVIPMVDTLRDIASRLGCIEVGFPSSPEILSEAIALKTTSKLVAPKIAASPPRTPKTPPPYDPQVDSGYGTKTQCTPQAPSTAEIHTLIRGSLPQEDNLASTLFTAVPQPELWRSRSGCASLSSSGFITRVKKRRRKGNDTKHKRSRDGDTDRASS